MGCSGLGIHPGGVNPAVVAALEQLIVARELRVETGSGSSLTRARRARRLIPLAHGLDLPAEIAAELTATELALTRALAVARYGRTRRPLARASAALVWGVPLLNSPPSAVEVLGWSAASTRAAGGLRYWGTAHPDAYVVEQDGVVLTSLARTLAEFAASHPFAAGVVAVDWALRVRGGGVRCSLDEIAEAADALGLRRGRARLERVLSFADGRSESPGESWSRVLIRQLGFADPELQVEVRGLRGELFRADFGWSGGRLLGEFDGREKYTSATMRGNRSASDRVVHEKRREDSVRATGRGVCRWDWSDLVHARRLAATLSAAGVPRR